MGYYIDFARIHWLSDHEGMAWNANCGATSDRTKPFRTPAAAARDLAKHFASCPTCVENAEGLNEKSPWD